MKAFYLSELEDPGHQRDSLRITAYSHAEAKALREFFVDVCGGMPEPDRCLGDSTPPEKRTLMATKNAKGLFCPHVMPGGWDVFIMFENYAEAEKFFDIAPGTGHREAILRLENYV